MKTVGDFKKLGGVVVAGDFTHKTPLDPVWCKEVNTYDSFDHYTIKSFAWRTNTGFTPNFNGVVEFELCDGDRFTAHISTLNFAVTVDDTLLIARWRPHLDAAKTENPAIKPAFTQEMADAGELPPIKSDVALSEDVAFYCHQHQHQLISAKGSVVLVTGYATRPDNNAVNVTLFNGKAFATINPDYVNPIDTRTDKEKAIDEMYKCVFNDELIDDDIRECDEYLFCVKSIEKGYRKQ